jgi:hypothetical protein
MMKTPYLHGVFIIVAVLFEKQAKNVGFEVFTTVKM